MDKNWFWASIFLIITVIVSGLLYQLKINVKQENQIEFDQNWHLHRVNYIKFNLEGDIMERFWADDLIRKADKYLFTAPKLEINDQKQMIWQISAKKGEKWGEQTNLEGEVRISPKHSWGGYRGVLTGDKFIYWDIKKRYSMQPVSLDFKDENNLAWHIEAERVDSQTLEELFLKDKILIQCLEKGLSVRTNLLQLNLVKQSAFTESPLKIKEFDNEIDAIGGKFWLRSGILELFSHIKILYDFAK